MECIINEESSGLTRLKEQRQYQDKNAGLHKHKEKNSTIYTINSSVFSKLYTNNEYLSLYCLCCRL